MRRLVLVKHSLPEIVPERPRQEWHLSEEGLRRCGPLAVHLRQYRPERIVSSPEPKARETADAIAAQLGEMHVEIVDDLREHDDRGVPFQSEASLRAAVSEFFARPAEAVFGPETADNAHAPFAGAISALAPPGDGRSHVVVAHGRVMSLFVARRNALDTFSFWERLGLPSFVVLGLPGFTLEKVIERVS